jgi:hypothetical protein
MACLVAASARSLAGTSAQSGSMRPLSWPRRGSGGGGGAGQQAHSRRGSWTGRSRPCPRAYPLREPGPATGRSGAYPGGILSARFGTPEPTPESSDWSVGRMLEGADPPEAFQPLAESKHPVVRPREIVSVTRPSGTLRCGDLLCQFRLTHQVCQSKLTDMDFEELSVNVSSDDPAIGLRASLALHRLAERVEANHVASAREKGWSWQQIGDALGITRQSVHTKYNKESS